MASRREHVVNDVLAAHQASDMQAALPGEGDYRASDARIASILDHPITRLEVDEVAQQERSGRGIDAQHRELLRISACWEREKLSRRQHEPLAPRGAGEWDQDTIADVEVMHLVPDGENAPDAFVTDTSGQGRPHAVYPTDQQEGRGVNRRVLHGDQHVANTRGVWLGERYQLHHLGRVAKGRDLKGRHDPSPTCCSCCCPPRSLGSL